MERPKKRVPKRTDDRMILHFDYDCFYASVFENQNPALKSMPLGVKQKSILATCNYVARSRGVKKLMLISEAKKLCPELVLVDGEDLTPFRDMSKTLFGFLRSYSWNKMVERLGFDEVFLDVTDMINYNLFCLNKGALSDSFFYLSRQDPEKGFTCDLTRIAGCVHGSAPELVDLGNHTYVRLLLASHLAQFLRLKIEEDFGFTSTCGVSTNKLLSKLAGTKNKPRNQTTLLGLNDKIVLDFMDSHKLREIPGIGFKTTHLLDNWLLSKQEEANSHTLDSALTAHEVRVHPNISPESLEKLLGGPGSEKGIGDKVWNLLHGVDSTEVKEASDVPSQISIEDTYKGLETLTQIQDQLIKLTSSLVRRMRIDLLTDDENAEDTGARRWIAHPKTLRLSIRSWPLRTDASNPSFARISRSQPLPGFIFGLREAPEVIAERLTTEALLPMLRKLQPEKDHQWNLQLINICVANMAISASEAGPGVGRDISIMFKRQDDVLRQWKIDTALNDDETSDGMSEEPLVDEMDGEVSWEEAYNTERCPKCGHSIPSFALSAHARYHLLGD